MSSVVNLGFFCVVTHTIHIAVARSTINPRTIISRLATTHHRGWVINSTHETENRTIEWRRVASGSSSQTRHKSRLAQAQPVIWKLKWLWELSAFLGYLSWNLSQISASSLFSHFSLYVNYGTTLPIWREIVQKNNPQRKKVSDRFHVEFSLNLGWVVCWIRVIVSGFSNKEPSNVFNHKKSCLETVLSLCHVQFIEPASLMGHQFFWIFFFADDLIHIIIIIIASCIHTLL